MTLCPPALTSAVCLRARATLQSYESTWDGCFAVMDAEAVGLVLAGVLLHLSGTTRELHLAGVIDQLHQQGDEPG